MFSVSCPILLLFLLLCFRADTYVHARSLLPSHCSLILHSPSSLVTVFVLVLLFPPSFYPVACTLCRFGAPFVPSSLCLHFAPFPLRTHTRTFFFRGTHSTHSPMHALCHLLVPPPSRSSFLCSPLARTPLFLVYACRLNASMSLATNFYRVVASLFLVMPGSKRVVFMH